MNKLFHSENLQLNSAGELQHFLSIDGLTAALLNKILDTAETFVSKDNTLQQRLDLLRDKIAANLFFETSTRTRSAFELAEKQCGMTILNLNINTSSTQKGETLLDTIANLIALGVELFVIRHAENGAPFFVAKNLLHKAAIINAGDGTHEHPTQALSDVFTIRRHKRDFTKLSVAIVGDIKHSRVARSQIFALSLLGVPEIRVIAPKTLLPTEIASLGVRVYHDLDTGLRDVDVITVLRLQTERMQAGLIASLAEYYRVYGITQEKLALAKPDALVLHPGPINQGVEIETQVAEGPQAVILQQVRYGVAVRMAVMSLLLKSRHVQE